MVILVATPKACACTQEWAPPTSTVRLYVADSGAKKIYRYHVSLGHDVSLWRSQLPLGAGLTPNYGSTQGYPSEKVAKSKRSLS